MMKRWIFLLGVFFLTACAGALRSDLAVQLTSSPDRQDGDAAGTLKKEAEVNLENYGPAPELTNEVWLNTDQPLRLADLRGKVVLLDMWTFG